MSKTEPTPPPPAPPLPSETGEEVATWLARLVLLYGVPLDYLVPDEAMLPPASLRFFFLDPIWIQALVQGACSIGSNGYGDAVIDQALNGWTQPNQPEKEKDPSLTNRKAAGVRDALRQQYEGAPPAAQRDSLDWPLTGFLLRSPVVDGWRGLEVLAYRKVSDAERARIDADALTPEQQKKLKDEGLAPLQVLRLEQLGRDIMLGIFNGIVAELVVRQPQEGLHFGLQRDETAVRKTLRELGFHDAQRTGQLLPQGIDLTAERLLREQAQPGVLRVNALASRIGSVLKDAGQLKDGAFTSAEFAVEMLEAAGEFRFQPRYVTP